MVWEYGIGALKTKGVYDWMGPARLRGWEQSRSIRAISLDDVAVKIETQY